MYFELGEYRLAIRDWSAAITRDSENVNPTPYHNLAVAYEEIGEHSLAVELYTKVIELDPNWDHRYFKRGCCYLKMGEYRKAIEDFKIALQLEPTSNAASEQLEAALSKLEEESEKE